MAQILSLSPAVSAAATPAASAAAARPRGDAGTPVQLALIGAFARRRQADDVFWLKENAELLNILQCTGHWFGSDSLAALAPFYAAAPRQLNFFRQYYRFILSICLDLEDLGLEGQHGAQMAEWAAARQLVQAELSDLQRAEARRLLARRGVELRDAGLDDRLRAFVSRPQTFAIPNKKAAYELTHIVFYLSGYGQRDPGLPELARTSLEYAGLVAFLDQNADLLAEICIALRYAGGEPPLQWEAWLDRQLGGFSLAEGEFYSFHDDYHAYFVLNWLMLLSGRRGFRQRVPAAAAAGGTGAAEGPRRAGMLQGLHVSAPQGGSVLKHLSDAVYEAGTAQPSWAAIKARSAALLSEQELGILTAAERSSEGFAEFFGWFARAGCAGRL